MKKIKLLFILSFTLFSCISEDRHAIKSNDTLLIIFRNIDLSYLYAQNQIAKVWLNYAGNIGVKTIEDAKKYANALAEDSKTQKWNFAKNTMTDLKTGTVYTGVEYNRKKLERDKYLNMQQQLSAPSTLYNTRVLQKSVIQRTIRAKDPSLYKNVITEFKKSPLGNVVLDGKVYSVIDFYNGIINGSIKEIGNKGGVQINPNGSLRGYSPIGKGRSYRFEINGKTYNLGKDKEAMDLIDHVYKTKESALGRSYDKVRIEALVECLDLIKNLEVDYQVKSKNPILYKNIVTELKKSKWNSLLVDGKDFTILDIYNGIINGSIKEIGNKGGIQINPDGSWRSSSSIGKGRSYRLEIDGKIIDYSNNASGMDLVDHVYKTKESALGKSYDKLREEALKEMNISTIANDTAAHVNPKNNN
jgi:hypothetical protein